MHVAPLCCVLVVFVTSVSSATISTPPMQRKSIGENCQFRWKVTGNFTTYNARRLSSSTALGPNTNLFNSNGVITLLIWDIQLSDAGYYSLTINTGLSTEVNSTVLLFVYAYPYSYVRQSVGRNPGHEGDIIELNCSATSYSMPVSYRPKMYYFWHIDSIGYLRNISSGPAVSQNGDIIPGYSIKNDGKTLVVASVQYTDFYYCTVQEEGSPYKSSSYLSLTIYSRPFSYSFYPASRRLNIQRYSYLYAYFFYRSNPALTSYTNWTFVNASGSIMEYSVGFNLLTSTYVSLSLYYVNSINQYGNYSITLTNSNGSTTTTFQILPPGPPDTPSNFSVQYLTNSRISLQWRCMWSNGAQQTVVVRLTDAVTNTELDTQYFRLQQSCYNSRYGTLFKRNIQPETSYEASIWSTNSYGSSNVVNLTLRTPERLIFIVTPSNISILENEATINFLILNSNITLIRMNVTCCVEITAECSNKSYILSNTDNQILYDILPAGTEYVFDFIVFGTDGYTYEYNLAIVKGVRVSTVPTTEGVFTSTPEGVLTSTTEGTFTSTTEAVSTSAIESVLTSTTEGTFTSTTEAVSTSAIESVLTSATEGVLTSAIESGLTSATDNVLTSATGRVLTSATERVLTSATGRVLTSAKDRGSISATEVENPTTSIPYGKTTSLRVFNGCAPYDHLNRLFGTVIVLAIHLGVAVLV